MNGPQAKIISGGRLHLSHGPCDLVVEAFGKADEISRAYLNAIKRFDTILEELCSELEQLRRPAREACLNLPVARAMRRAVLPHADKFITPMAAVAGAVADEILAAMMASVVLDKAYVNNGGDIALWLGRGETFITAMAEPENPGAAGGRIRIGHNDGIGGIATSGRGGRSFSRGIADAVTVLAANAASADAAATMIANEVNLAGSPKVHTLPASRLSPDSDLGMLAVTVAVDDLDHDEMQTALDGGERAAQEMIKDGLIRAAVMRLGDCLRIVDERPNRYTLAGKARIHQGRQHA